MRKTTDEKIAVMEAFVAGTKCQLLSLTGYAGWQDVNGLLDWDWAGFDFRIKPAEPRSFFRIQYPDAGLGAAWHNTRQDAEDYTVMANPVIVEFKEVIS